MKSIVELQKELFDIGEAMVGRPRPNGLFIMPDLPTHSGAPHVEIVNGEYHYVVTERGSELERRIARDEDELLYWFVSDSAFSAACSWELRHRKENEDSRRQLFSKQIEMLEKINPKWAERKARHYEQVLKNNPFTC